MTQSAVLWSASDADHTLVTALSLWRSCLAPSTSATTSKCARRRRLPFGQTTSASAAHGRVHAPVGESEFATRAGGSPSRRWRRRSWSSRKVAATPPPPVATALNLRWTQSDLATLRSATPSAVTLDQESFKRHLARMQRPARVNADAILLKFMSLCWMELPSAKLSW
jgi:hypothetical protein